MVCQLHALLPAVARPSASSAVALQAGSTIASIMQAIVSHGQVAYVPPSVYGPVHMAYPSKKYEI